MNTEQRCIDWTETARLQLVEAVIKVEKEMMVQKSKKSSPGSPFHLLGSLTWQKWNAITRLLPVELRAKTCNRDRQTYYLPKCHRMFQNLVKGYRDKVQGKGNVWNLTEPVCRLLKIREDLLNGMSPVPGEKRLRPGSSKRVSSSKVSSRTLRSPRLSKGAASSSEGQSSSSVREKEDASSSEHTHALENTEEVKNFDSIAEREERNHIREGKSEGNAKIQSTEAACLLVIEAVTQVEYEIRNESNLRFRSSTRGLMGKWERVDSELPPALRGKTSSNRFRCQRFFATLLKGYRDTIKRKDREGSNHYMLTKPVYVLLKRLLNARTSARESKYMKLGPSDRLSIGTCSANDQEHVSAASKNSLNSDTNQQLSSEGLSVRTATGKGASFFLSEHTNYSEKTGKVPHFDMELTKITHEKFTERNINANLSLGCPSRSLSLTHGTHNLYEPPSSAPGPASVSWGDSEDSKEMAKPSARSDVQTRAPIQTKEKHLKFSTKPLCNNPRTSSFVRKNTNSMTPTRYDESMHAIVERPLRVLGLEFFLLRSWVDCQSVPVCTKLTKEMTSSAIRFCKRRKLNDGTSTEPFDLIGDNCLSVCMDLQIRAAFQKLKIRFAEEMTSTFAKLAQELHQGTELLCKSPNSSPGVNRPRPTKSI